MPDLLLPLYHSARHRVHCWLDSGVDPATGPLVAKHLRRCRGLTLVMLVFALPAALAAWTFGRNVMALAFAAAALAWLGLLLTPWLWRRASTAGHLAVAILLGAFLVPRLVTPAFPLAGHFELVAVAALVLTGLRGGLPWSAVATAAVVVAGLRSAAPAGEIAAGVVLVAAVAGSMATLLVLEERTDVAMEAEIARRRAAEQRARAADEAKSEFLTNMSHELRTPIGGILGLAHLLHRAELTEHERRHLELLGGSAETLLALVDDILDLSRIEAGRLSIQQGSVQPRILAEELRRTFEPQATSKGIILDHEVAGDLPEAVQGDPLRLRQVLLNLIGNAIKFTDAGRIEIHVEEVAVEVMAGEDAGRAELTNQIRFAVRDTGKGIATADQQRIFQPFSQVDSSSSRGHGGAGLGLAISRRLVRLMGGELRLESARGVGSTFFFHLPAVPVDAPAVVPPPNPVALPSGARVLLVDDDPVNRLVGEGYLDELGLASEVVAGGRQALAALAAVSWDVVLMDCQMPGIDGYETTLKWRRKEAAAGRRRTPILAVTAHAMEGEREKCLAAGMDDYLAKPFRIDELAAVLGRWLVSPADATPGPAPAAAAPPKGPAAESLPELDLSTIAAITRWSAKKGDDRLTEMIDLHGREGETLLAEMHHALAGGGALALAAAVHRLAGNSGALGGRRLAAQASDFEQRARDGDVDEADLARLEDAFRRFRTALGAYVRDMS